MFLIPRYVSPILWASWSSRTDLQILKVQICLKSFNLDRLRWYCAKCGEIVYEDAFHCTDLGTQIKTAVEKFAGSEELRTCKKCGTVAQTKYYES